MARILIVAATEMAEALGRTRLFRADVERTHCPDMAKAVESARSFRPSLVLIEARDLDGTRALVHELRADVATRGVSVAVFNASSLSDDDLVVRTGANVVVPAQVGSASYDSAPLDSRLDDLLSVPHRRALRVPVRYFIWTWPGPLEDKLYEASTVNLSASGMLIAVAAALALETQLDFRFSLPDGEEIRGVGEVTRIFTTPAGASHLGLQFLLLRGDGPERIRAFVASSEAGPETPPSGHQ